MPLNPNRYTKEVIEDLATADDYSEALHSIQIEAGWYDNAGTGESHLIEEKIVALNQFGQIIRQDEKRYSYDVPGSPPMKFERDTYARPYLPGVNTSRRVILVESERVKYHPWSLFQAGSPNLSRERIVSGWVVYDMTPDGTALTAEQKEELRAKGLNPDGPPQIVVDSARRWEEANHGAEAVEAPEVPQVSKWIDPMESEFEIVFEEPDKYTSYRYTKNHLRPQDMKVRGPTHSRKPSYSYSLPVEIEAPQITASSAGDDGVRIRVNGGGAQVLDQFVVPEKYQILRKTISSPAPPENSDPYGLYDENPPPSSSAKIWIDTAVTDPSGTPTSPLPAQEPYVEPGDTSEPDGDEWLMIAEVDNATPLEDEGTAEIVDGDVISTAVYEYVATAKIGSDESAPSTPARWTYGGATRTSKITAAVLRNQDGDLEIDVLAPDPEIYGETEIYDLPLAVLEEDAGELGEEIGRRHFVRDLAPAMNVDMDVTLPLIVLQRGQKIRTPAIDWTSANDLAGLVITSETEERDWILDGYRITAQKDADGSLQLQGTTLYLTER